MPERGPRKYDPLTRYLAGLTVDEVTLPFAEIERLVGAALPRTAWGPAFWSNSREGVFRVRPWVRAGWRVARAHLRGESPAVTFQRVPR